MLSFLSKRKTVACVLVCFLLVPTRSSAMHIAEGFLPAKWCIAWYVLMIPFLGIGLHQIKKKVQTSPKTKMILSVAGGLCFLLSALKIPSITGSCSHMTGAGLGTILFGPFVMSVIGTIVLIFQALLLAHGGLTTLGANSFSMAIAGPIVGFIAYRLLQSCKLPTLVCVFISGFLTDIFTYIVTASQLAVAFQNQAGFLSSWIKFMTLFAYTQLPLAIIEGLITVAVFKYIQTQQTIING